MSEPEGANIEVILQDKFPFGGVPKHLRQLQKPHVKNKKGHKAGHTEHESEMPDAKRLKKIHSAAVGQKYHLHYPHLRNVKRQMKKQVENPKEYSENSIKMSENIYLDTCISDFRGCVCGRKENLRSCYLKMFFDENTGMPNRNSAVEALRKYRGVTKHKTDQEIIEFTNECFRSSIVGVRIDGKFEMKYELDEHEVCRDTFCFAYSLSAFQLKTISRLHKESADGSINAQKESVWEDDRVHEFTYLETREMFENLVKRAPAEEEKAAQALNGIGLAASLFILVAFLLYLSLSALFV